MRNPRSLGCGTRRCTRIPLVSPTGLSVLFPEETPPWCNSPALLPNRGRWWLLFSIWTKKRIGFGQREVFPSFKNKGGAVSASKKKWETTGIQLVGCNGVPCHHTICRGVDEYSIEPAMGCLEDLSRNGAALAEVVHPVPRYADWGKESTTWAKRDALRCRWVKVSFWSGCGSLWGLKHLSR